MSDLTEIRASDQERERTAQVVRRHYADGRLTTEEMTERLDRAYEARTRGELDALVADLPEERRRPERRRADRPRRLGRVPFLPVPALVWIAIAATIAIPHFGWIAWPLLFGFVLPWRHGHGCRKRSRVV